MSFPISPASRSKWVRFGRIVLGLAVGASFGISVGALVASWIWGVEAIESEAVAASYLAGGMTLFGAAVGGFFGFRAGRSGATDSDPARSRG